jgi:hypothetical protein
MACILAENPGLEVVGVLSNPADLTASVATTRPDCVIASLGESSVQHACRELLARNPHMRLLAIADRGRRGLLYEPPPLHLVGGLRGARPLGELSAQTLLEAVHARPHTEDRGG